MNFLQSEKKTAERVAELIQLAQKIGYSVDLESMDDLVTSDKVGYQKCGMTSYYIFAASSSECVVYLYNDGTPLLNSVLVLSTYDARQVHGRKRSRYIGYFVEQIETFLNERGCVL